MLAHIFLFIAVAFTTGAGAQEKAILNPELRELDRQLQQVYADRHFRFYYAGYFKKGFYGGFFYPARVEESAEVSELPPLVPTEMLGKIDKNPAALGVWLKLLEARARMLSEDPGFALDRRTVVISHVEGKAHKYLVEGFLWSGTFRCPFLSYLDLDSPTESRVFLPEGRNPAHDSQLNRLADIQARLAALQISTEPPKGMSPARHAR